MSTALDRGWGEPGCSREQLTRVDVDGDLPFLVRDEVAPLFRGLVRELNAARDAHGIDPLTSSGGYNHRPKRGREAAYARTGDPALLSEHSWGLAGDLSAPSNPMRRPLTTDMPPETAAIARRWHLSWGGLWAGTPDPMHFEFLGTPEDAADAVAALGDQKEDQMTPAQEKWIEAKFAEAVKQLAAPIAELKQWVVDGRTNDDVRYAAQSAALEKLAQAQGLPAGEVTAVIERAVHEALADVEITLKARG